MTLTESIKEQLFHTTPTSPIYYMASLDIFNLHMKTAVLFELLDVMKQEGDIKSVIEERIKILEK